MMKVYLHCFSCRIRTVVFKTKQGRHGSVLMARDGEMLQLYNETYNLETIYSQGIKEEHSRALAR